MKSRPSPLDALDEVQRIEGMVERLVYNLWRPLLAPLRHLSGYVSRQQDRHQD